MHVGQLDGVGDGLDLGVQAAHVRVGDVGDLFEDELLALELGQLLDEELGAHVHQQRVAGPQLHAEHVLGELGHPLLVGPGEDHAAPLVLELLLQGDDLAGELPVAHEDHVEALVEDDLVPLADRTGVDVGVQADPHLPAAREDVDRAVLVDAEERAVGRRRLGQLLDLLAEGGQLLLGLLQGEGQLLVLRGGLGQLALRLEQALLEGLHPARALLQPAPERVDLILGVCQLGAQRLGLGSGFVGSCGHRTVTLALASARFAGNERAPSDAPGQQAGTSTLGATAKPDLTARGTPHYGPRGPSGGCDKGERQVHEGLDRPGSLHGRRAVRGDRACRVHPPRRRPGLREGRGRRQERARAARPGWPRCRATSRMRWSRPPRSAPASASSSSATSRLASGLERARRATPAVRRR